MPRLVTLTGQSGTGLGVGWPNVYVILPSTFDAIIFCLIPISF